MKTKQKLKCTKKRENIHAEVRVYTMTTTYVSIQLSDYWTKLVLNNYLFKIIILQEFFSSVHTKQDSTVFYN